MSKQQLENKKDNKKTVAIKKTATVKKTPEKTSGKDYLLNNSESKVMISYGNNEIFAISKFVEISKVPKECLDSNNFKSLLDSKIIEKCSKEEVDKALALCKDNEESIKKNIKKMSRQITSMLSNDDIEINDINFALREFIKTKEIEKNNTMETEAFLKYIKGKKNNLNILKEAISENTTLGRLSKNMAEYPIIEERLDGIFSTTPIDSLKEKIADLIKELLFNDAVKR